MYVGITAAFLPLMLKPTVAPVGAAAGAAVGTTVGGRAEVATAGAVGPACAAVPAAGAAVGLLGAGAAQAASRNCRPLPASTPPAVRRANVRRVIVVPDCA